VHSVNEFTMLFSAALQNTSKACAVEVIRRRAAATKINQCRQDVTVLHKCISTFAGRNDSWPASNQCRVQPCVPVRPLAARKL
jgi:hypothetical protein